MKTQVELVIDKLIMSLNGLHTSNSPRQIDHPKCTILENEIVVLDVKIKNYFKDSLLEDVICENFPSGSSESIISTFTVPRYFKEPSSVMKIIFQRGVYDMTSGEAIKMNLRLLFVWNFCTKNHKVMRRYHTT